MQLILSRLKERDLYVRKKNKLLCEETDILRLVFDRNGIKIGDDCKAVIKYWHLPKHITELSRCFVFLVRFFRRFIKDVSTIAAPLTNSTRNKSAITNRNKECDAAFLNLRELFTTAPITKASNWTKSFTCQTDTSQLSVGGTLSQFVNEGCEHVIYYFSKRLSPAEEKNTADDREPLGFVYFLQRFRYYLEGT